MNTLDQMKLVRVFLDNPKHWTKGVGARNHEGVHVAVASQDATCWCLFGAVGKVCKVNAFWMGAASVEDASSSDEARQAAAEITLALRTHGSEFLRLKFRSRCITGPSCEPSITAFNDHPETTLQDVWQFLDVVIAGMELSGGYVH